jgi:(2Fe-2S) ferredoxin
MSDRSYYSHHAFICENLRDPDHARGCCKAKGASELRDYLKSRVKELKLNGKSKIRVNSSGCLDRCELGPVLVIYPDECWYHFETREDIDEILQSHLIEGTPVERLKLKRNQVEL